MTDMQSQMTAVYMIMNGRFGKTEQEASHDLMYSCI